jgi:hypothetical protein
MLKWCVAFAFVVLLVALLLWQLGDATPGAPASSQVDDRARRQHASSARDGGDPTRSGQEHDGAPARELDGGRAVASRVDLRPQERDGEALSRRLDVDVPARLRASAARCYDGSLDPDLVIRIGLRLRVVGGEVSTADVALADSEIGDDVLERCMVAAVAAARWRDAELPDLDEAQELFIRLRTLGKYVPGARQNGSKAYTE